MIKNQEIYRRRAQARRWDALERMTPEESIAIGEALLTSEIEEVDEQLSREPLGEIRRRKVLRGLVPPWDQLGPVRQLSIGDFRVFYDVDEVKKEVVVRAVRYKTPHKTTEEVL